MKLASEATAGLWVPLVPSLDGLLARLKSLSLESGLAAQRQIALGLALQPYLAGGAGALLSPLPQETVLANLLLYADFYPQDGQLTLIEQLRDVITEHIPHLYALALYDHSEYRYMAEATAGLQGFEREAAVPSPGGASAAKDAHHFVQRGACGALESGVVARLILTATQLWVECDSRERLDAIKHRLAATFGFSLHFCGETCTPPPRQLKESELAVEEPLTLVLSAEEDRALLNGFLENLYLEWAERACPSLGNHMPRHVATSAAGREQVEALIADMERHDPGIRRAGHAAFDYNRLRAQVGLDEVAR